MAHHPFSGLADDERDSVLARMQPRRYAPGDLVLLEGDVGDSLHVVDAGHLAVRRSSPDGDVVTLTVLGPGDSFGELGLLAPHHRRTADVVALDQVRTRVLRRADLDALRQHLPHLDRGLLAVLVQQVERLSQQVLEALYLPVDERVVRTLHRLVRLYRVDGGPGPVVIPLRQEDVASMAGTSRSTVNRLCMQLQAQGVLRLGRGRTEVLRPERLVRTPAGVEVGRA